MNGEIGVALSAEKVYKFFFKRSLALVVFGAVGVGGLFGYYGGFGGFGYYVEIRHFNSPQSVL